MVNAPAGFLLARPRGFAGSPYIASIAVAPTHRSRGVGSAMLRHVEARYAPPARHIFLLCSTFNHRAQQLYVRHGYARVGEIPAYVIDVRERTDLPQAPRAVTAPRWRWVALLSLTAIASYLARVNITVAGEQIMSEFSLTQPQMGRVFSAFVLGYALAMIPGGALADRWGTRRVLAARPGAGCW